MEETKVNNELRAPTDIQVVAKVRSNTMVVCELAYERDTTSQMLTKLKKAIEADPKAVSAHHKDLWRKQAKAMQEYVDVLGERIKDLIDNG
ncbi:hypothetical protein [uncultured Fibrobacter sp.]|uniref:crAss001_48 related protein n=1 Tax=uncultured Fibrobacter sp. TaxID=261512 RepID=UPI0025F3A42B|nr:hypothetical protein [uncultured Fibrobacter sp.]